MSIYYISTSDGTIYELDATLNVNYRETAVVTDNVVESGESVADHCYNKPVTFSLNGVITDIKSVSSGNENAKSTKEFIDGLKSVLYSKQTFTFHFGEKVGSFSNCMFESLDIGQDSTHGNVKDVDSFSVSASIKQLRLAQRAALVPSRSVIPTTGSGTPSDNYQSQTKGAGSTEELTEQEEEMLDTYSQALMLITEG